MFGKKQKKVLTTFECNHFSLFCDLVKDQFEYGGKKYALNATRESTDELFDIYGRNWLLGTMAKYCFRYKNLKRERDILKIACYSYIMWLKRGYFLQPQGLDHDAVDTNVAIKSENFAKFVVGVGHQFEIQKGNTFAEKVHASFLGLLETGDNTPLEIVGSILEKAAGETWESIKSHMLHLIFALCFMQWVKDGYHKLQGKVHDTDTYNTTAK